MYFSELLQFILTPDKTIFFSDSPFYFLFTFIGIGYILTIFLLSFVVGVCYQTVARYLVGKKKKVLSAKKYVPPKNIGSRDRWTRALIGIVLFVIAVTSSWSPLMLFFAGFSFFEAVFSWCALYAAMGKNTCPIS